MSSNRVFTSFPALAALLILAGCQAETAPAPEAERPVEVAPVVFADAAVSQDFVGIIGPRHETDLAFRVGGKIVTRLVDAGDTVRAGDVIAEIDADDLTLQVEAAEAELAAATSSLSQAADDRDRFETLRARGFATAADFDRKQAAADEAAGRVERARRSLDLARNQFGYGTLKADVDGVITAAVAEPGQVVAAGQPIAKLAHRGDKEAVIALPETWYAAAKDADATVKLWADGDRVFQAHLRELAPQADPTTRTYAARFAIDDAGDTVALGMTATVTLTRRAGPPVARLPLSAVLSRGDGASVFLVDDKDRLVLKPVTVSAFTEESALVTDGVSDGDRVVTLGVHKLEARRKVRPVPAE